MRLYLVEPKTSLIILVTWAFLFLSFVRPATGENGLADNKGLTRLTFLPQWAPQAQFAGYYMALRRGIYKRYGLDVKFFRGGPANPADLCIAKECADIVMMPLATGIKKRSEGLPVVCVAVMFRHTAFMLIAKKSAGIEKPQDLMGKRVSLWGSPHNLLAEAFFRKFGVKVQKLTQLYTIDLFLKGCVEATSAMYYNEYHTIIMSGLNPDELTLFKMRDYGLDIPEDSIFVSEGTYQKKREAILKFIKASFEGWKYAFEHPDETVDEIVKWMKKNRVPANRVHQKWMLEHVKDLVKPQFSCPLGNLTADEYARIARWLMKKGLIYSIPTYEEFFKGYGKGDCKS